jgi:ribonuclease HI
VIFNSNTEEEYIVYADGACSGNPGVGGWGVYIESQLISIEEFGYEMDTTNNRMELTAAIKAFDFIKNKKTSKITVYTDSQYVQKGMTEWIYGWQKSGKLSENSKNKVKNLDLWLELISISSEYKNVLWLWVRGHDGNFGNEKADQLAQKGVLEAIRIRNYK